MLYKNKKISQSIVFFSFSPHKSHFCNMLADSLVLKNINNFNILAYKHLTNPIFMTAYNEKARRISRLIQGRSVRRAVSCISEETTGRTSGYSPEQG